MKSLFSVLVDVAITLIVNHVKLLGVIFFIVCLNLYCFPLFFFDLCFRCRKKSGSGVQQLRGIEHTVVRTKGLTLFVAVSSLVVEWAFEAIWGRAVEFITL